MRYGRLAAAAAFVIGSIALGSTITQGSEAPATGASPRAAEPAAWETSSSDKAPGDAAPEEFATGGLTFFPITPYRSYDSRVFGPINGGLELFGSILIDTNGIQQIPDTAQAVTFNLTATNTNGGGAFLAVFPADVVWPGNSTVNWSGSGVSVANGGVTTLGNLTGPGQISIYMGPATEPSWTADFIIDITGYYE